MLHESLDLRALRQRQVPWRPLAASSSGRLEDAQVLWLSGLTGTDEVLSQRATNALEAAQELGLILIMPDTSPRGEGVPDEEPKAFDVGVGASFYVNATTEKYKCLGLRGSSFRASPQRSHGSGLFLLATRFLDTHETLLHIPRCDTEEEILKLRKHYQMLDYITQEVPNMIAAKLPLQMTRLGIMGHSMGGHGALVAALPLAKSPLKAL